MGRDITAPFLLSILPDIDSSFDTNNNQASTQADLEIKKILRLLPGKRLVAVGQWEGKSVIAKLFFQAGHWKRHIRRERNGIELISQAELPTPQALLCSTMADNHGGVMISQYLEGGQGVGDLLAASEFQNQHLTQEVLNLVIKCYAKGLWQNDIHLNNFLLYNEKVYLLDGADIRTETVANSVSEKTRLKNLALFFAQFPVKHDQQLERLMSCVSYHGAEYMKIHSVPELAGRVKKARDGRIDAYNKKLTRSSTAHYAHQSASSFMVCDREILSDDFSNFVNNPDLYIERGKMVKAGNTSTVAIVEIGQKHYMLKRYNVKNIVHGLKRFIGQLFGHSRALNSWRFALILPLLGINTAKPFMMLEKRVFRCIPRESYILCEIIDGHAVSTLIEDENLGSSEKSAVISAFRDYFGVMRDTRISHGDLKATNFIYSNEKLYVLDLDAMKRHKGEVSFKKSFGKDLERFTKNWAGRLEFESITKQALRVTRAFID